MKVLFVAGFGPIVRDMDAALRFYRDTIGLPLEEKGDVSTEKVEGVKHFGLWFRFARVAVEPDRAAGVDGVRR
jgi:catechol 2,3-dioxygenase-like lactoylglutathione lyase family enzyme